jgi:hypothetical protein
MARWRERVPLESGLKLDINRLIRDDIIRPGEHSIWRITWRTGDGHVYDSARAITEMRPGKFPHLTIEHAGREQQISLCFAHRHFGGRQWYFACPRTHERVSVLWKPPGSPYFASRHAFGRQVAYSSQFETPRDRAISQARSIRNRLGGEADLSADFPPKPKGMRWTTYERLQRKCEAYDASWVASTWAFLQRLKTLR